MPVFRWGHTLGTLHDLEREMDRLLQTMSVSFQSAGRGRMFPAINIYETDADFRLTAEIPGVKAADLEITVAGGLLTLKGQSRDADSVPDERYRRRERRVGRWERSLRLPDRIDSDQLRAELNHGVLVIYLPKVRAVEARQIPILETESD